MNDILGILAQYIAGGEKIQAIRPNNETEPTGFVVLFIVSKDLINWDLLNLHLKCCGWAVD
jgi:hypothetical protein